MGTEKWTPEAIVARLKAWNTRYGTSPRSSDWAHSGADIDGAHPSEATVKSKFGSWNQAIQRAELEVRPQGRPSTPLTNTVQSTAGVNATWVVPSTNTQMIPANLYSSSQPYYYPVYTDTGAQKKLDALKAVLEQDPETPASVLLAIIQA